MLLILDVNGSIGVATQIARLAMSIYCAPCIVYNDTHYHDIHNHELLIGNIHIFMAAWISTQMLSKVWDGITYSFQNFNGMTGEVQEWISNFVPNVIMDDIIYPCWHSS